MPESESKSADVGREGYDMEIWEEAVQRVEDRLDRGTAVVHEEVVKIFHERGVKNENKIPTYRTTFGKLEDLRREGEVAKREVGNSNQWLPQTEDLEDRVLRALRERESGTVEKIAEDLGGVDVDEVEDALRELGKDGEVESVEVGSREIWAPLD
jgi:hypothetical protein